MKAKLISPDTLLFNWEIALDHFPVVIGRIAVAEIQPVDPTVSDVHCEIDEVNGRLVVRDLGSERGTFVNNKSVGAAPLLPGDKLTVGESNFVALYEVDDLSDDEHNELRTMTTFLDLYNLIERQRHSYRALYGKDLQPDDPMIDDPPHPEHLEHVFVEEMRQAGEDPAVIYAFEKTGLLVTEFNCDFLTNEEMALWEAALDEYEQQHDEWCDRTEFPVGAIVLRGPDKTTTTMVTAAVIFGENQQPNHRRWVGSQVKDDPRVLAESRRFFVSHSVKSVFTVQENVSCPHDEGLDYPPGEDCPFCPYWKGKQGRK